MSVFDQADIVHEVLLFLNHRDWKCCFPFVIGRTFLKVMTCESFAESYYANYKSLSSSQLIDLKEKISQHSICYKTKEEKEPTKKRKIEPKPFCKLLRDCLLDSYYMDNNIQGGSMSGFGWITNYTKKDINLKKQFSVLLAKDFCVKKFEDDTGLIIKSQHVKKLLELEKVDVQVHRLDYNNSCYFNSSSHTLNIDYTIYMDCGYPIHVNSKLFNISVRSGNYVESSLSTTVNGTNIFEWNYNEDVFKMKNINTEFLTGIVEDIFQRKEELWNEIEKETERKIDSKESIYKHLFLKLLDPLIYFQSTRIGVDEYYVMEKVTMSLPYYFSTWK